ncbi:MAG: phosphotransferase family protein [Acidimicrobiales bacterium]
MGTTAAVGPSTGDGPVGGEPEHVTTSTRDRDDLAARLGAWLRSTLPARAAPELIEASSPEGNGMSSETVLFTARWEEDGVRADHPLVARIEPPATAWPVFPTYDLDMQFRVMQLVRERTGVPVPEPLWYEADPDPLGGAFFVMARIDGFVPRDVMPYTFGDNWVFDASEADRRRLQDSALRALAGIHALTPANADLTFLEHREPGATSLERSFNHWSAYHDWVVADAASPLLARGFAWLRERLPGDVGPDVLSWGDSRIGNMIFRDNEVVAVLDWEMAAVAPPEVDLGWMCYLHLFFQDLTMDLGAPGLPDLFRPNDVARQYAAITGREPSDFIWFVAYAAIRHGVIMRRVTERSILFGEAERPEDIDDLILHRATLEAMVEGSYWSRVGLG